MPTTAEGVLIVTVDLGMDCGGKGRQVGQATGQAASWLVDELNRYKVPATWAADEPALAMMIGQLLACGRGHEPALLADATWAGSGVPRGHFAREISRRVLSARAAGLSLSACMARERIPDEQLDVLVKHSITALCNPGDSVVACSRQGVEIRRRCFGLWELSVSAVLPSFTAFPWRLGANLRLDRALRRTAAGGTISHVLIDVARVAAAGAGARAQLTRFLHTTATLCGEGALRVETLSQAVLRKARPCPVMPSRSILRRAA
jgi:hypothetical protein